MANLERAESVDAPEVAHPEQAEPTRHIFKRGLLHESEVFWKTHQPWLDELGYTVRPRYRQGWKASWLEPGAKVKWHEAEDGQILSVSPNFRPHHWPITNTILVSMSISSTQLGDPTSSMSSSNRPTHPRTRLKWTSLSHFPRMTCALILAIILCLSLTFYTPRARMTRYSL
jgi:hypothetical protein